MIREQLRFSEYMFNKSFWIYGLLLLVIAFSFVVFGQQRGERLKKILEQRRNGQTSNSLTSGEINIDGKRRTYLVHLPPNYSKEKPLPLVLVFHGGGGNAQNMVNMSGFNQKADEENFIVVYPNGSGRTDNILLTFNAIGCCSYAMQQNVDDVKFISKLIDKVSKVYAVDTKRVYATGFSNGGLISNRLAAEIPEKLAAIAPVSGTIFESSPKPKGKVAVLIIHGIKDSAVPYEGGNSQRSLVSNNQSEPFKSVAYTANYWAKNNNCKDIPAKTNDGKVIREKFSGCASGNDVEIISIIDGTHAWAGGQKGREQADTPSTAINATDEIWEFFKRHKKP